MSSEIPLIGLIGYSTIDINVTHKETSTSPGGGAYFAALAASRITEPVGLITRVGDDYETGLFLNRVAPEGIRIISGGKTTRSTIVYRSETDHTDRHTSVDWGVSVLLEGNDIPEEWLSLLKIVHIGTMIPTQQHTIIEYIRTFAPQAKISIDTDSFLLKDQKNRATVVNNFELSDIGFVNRIEYEILGRTVDRMPEAVIKFDQEGAFYIKNGIPVAHEKADKVKVVDATGAGDILAGTFLACQLVGYSFKKALNEAVKTATRFVAKKGIAHLFEEGDK